MHKLILDMELNLRFSHLQSVFSGVGAYNTSAQQIKSEPMDATTPYSTTKQEPVKTTKEEYKTQDESKHCIKVEPKTQIKDDKCSPNSFT